mgnify:CR=1 FL=1
MRAKVTVTPRTPLSFRDMLTRSSNVDQQQERMEGEEATEQQEASRCIGEVNKEKETQTTTVYTELETNAEEQRKEEEMVESKSVESETDSADETAI